MAETRKPLNPLERQEASGILDGSKGEATPSTRHGTGVDPSRDGHAARDDLKDSTRSDETEYKIDTAHRNQG
jgi:hypothetical protein